MTKEDKFGAVMKAALADDVCKFRPDKSVLTDIKARLKEEQLSKHLYIRSGAADNKPDSKCIKEEYVIVSGRYNMFQLKRRKALVLALAAILVVLMLGGAIGAGAANIFRTDKTDYPFADDPQVIGKWQSVDFVRNISDFKPEERAWKNDLYLKELAFIKDGGMLFSTFTGNGNLAYTPMTWTKGLILNSNEKTASKYEFVEIEGIQYMFMEWKSGDYILRDMQPSYYVLVKIDSQDYSGYKPQRKVDKIDYDFVPDPEVVGKWESVDFVRTKDSFDPDKRQWVMDLYLTGLNFSENGKMTFGTGYSIKWTKGLVLHPADQTASEYEIRQINGSTYLFFQWKSGDYIFRGMEPYYYVLKKVE